MGFQSTFFSVFRLAGRVRVSFAPANSQTKERTLNDANRKAMIGAGFNRVVYVTRVEAEARELKCQMANSYVRAAVVKRIEAASGPVWVLLVASEALERAHAVRLRVLAQDR